MATANPGDRKCGNAIPGVFERRWLRIGLLTVAVFALGLAQLERFWRSKGHAPSVKDTTELWRWHFDRACGNDPNSLVFIGTSRMQSAISLQACREQLPLSRVAQLAIVGDGSPLGVLDCLSRRDDFKGTVVCEVMEPLLWRRTWSAYSDYYNRKSELLSEIETLMSAFLQDRLVLLRRDLALRRLVLQAIKTGGLPLPAYDRMDFHRVLRLDFDRARDIADLQAQGLNDLRQRLQPFAQNLPNALDGVSEIRAMMARIARRGGRVIFLRLPSSGDRLALEAKHFPKEKVWRQFVFQVGPAAVHTDDFLIPRTIPLPEDTHIGYRDSWYFTTRFFAELKGRGLVAGPRA